MIKPLVVLATASLALSACGGVTGPPETGANSSSRNAADIANRGNVGGPGNPANFYPNGAYGFRLN